MVISAPFGRGQEEKIPKHTLSLSQKCLTLKKKGNLTLAKKSANLSLSGIPYKAAKALRRERRAHR